MNLNEEIGKILDGYEQGITQHVGFSQYGATQALLHLFEKMGEETIGEDDEILKEDTIDATYYRKVRNNLRAEQRQKLAHLTQNIEEGKK